MGYRHYFYLVKQENIEKVNLYRETDIKLLREEDEFFFYYRLYEGYRSI